LSDLRLLPKPIYRLNDTQKTLEFDVFDVAWWKALFTGNVEEEEKGV
jgi:hypothetical protein